jgi:mono/diheme cytochrome c family protein
MKRLAFGLFICVPFLLGAVPGDTDPAAAEAHRVAQGHYLVHNVAMCVQCHSPRDAAGNLSETELLVGGDLRVQFGYQNNWNWAYRPPMIAGLPGYTDEQAMRLLTEGVTRTGAPPRPPMPPFRLSEDDARAVIAYLRSL